MKHFIVRSFIFFVLAILISVGVYVLVSGYLSDTTSQTKAISEVITKNTASTTKAKADQIKDKALQTVDTIPEQGIPLSTLKLSAEQKALLKKVGINTDTFVLTKTMLTCAGDKLGEDRMLEISKGATPSVFEVTKLVPCLSS